MSDINDFIDGLIQLDAERQQIITIMDKIRRLERWTKKECGNCDKWMKSSLCPYEKNVNGQTRGPSMSSPTCGEFVLNELNQEFRNKEAMEISTMPGIKSFKEGYLIANGIPAPEKEGE